MLLIEIHLDNPKATYEVGQVVQGRVIINVEDDKMKAKRITVKLSGKAKVRWKAGKRVYYGLEQYHGEEIELLDKTAETHELPSGSHTFPFRFQLRSDIPASFNYASYLLGKVDYHIKVTLDRPWIPNNMLKKRFWVCSRPNSNVQPDTVSELRNNVEKKISNACFSAGTVSASVHVPCNYYSPGDTVTVSGEIENSSSQRVRVYNVGLFRRYDFHANYMNNRMNNRMNNYNSRSVSDTVVDVRGPAIQPGQRQTFQESITIPVETDPSLLIGCSIIKVHYFITLHVHPFGVAVPVEISVVNKPQDGEDTIKLQEMGTATGFSSTVFSSGLTQGSQGGAQEFSNFSSAFTYDT